MDLFEAPLPTLNIKGSSVVKTSLGGLLSILIMLSVGLFATVKFEHLVLRRNPSVNKYESENEHDAEKIFDTKHDDYAMAFALTDYMTGEPKDDPRIIRWYAVYWKNVDSVLERRLIPVYTCTDADYSNFKEPI